MQTNTPSQNHELFWLDLERNSKSNIKKVKKEKVLSNESYANELYKIYDLNVTACKTITTGSVLNGKVISINDKNTIVDVNYKDYVVVDNTNSDSKIIATLNINQDISVAVTAITEKPYLIKGSFAVASNIKNYDVMNRYKGTNNSINITVLSHVGGGYIVEALIDDLAIEAFLPNIFAGANKIIDPSTLIGKTMDVLVDNYSQDKNQWVVSRKAYLDLIAPDAIKKLKVGETVYEGIVTGTTTYGIFVEFCDGVLTGMIHKANLNPAYIDQYSQIVPGMPVEFYVKEVMKGGKPILTQILRETIWDDIKSGKVRVGSKLTGKIKEEKPFGILIQLDEETLGLLHSTELSKLTSKVEIGAEIDVKISSINKNDRKLNLTV